MKRNNVLRNEQGFTLIEIIAVLVILGILAAVALPKYFDMAANAETKALDGAIAELNARENLAWANAKLSTTGWTADSTVFTAAGTDLGGDYTWSVAATAAGGTLKLTNGNSTATLTRTASSTSAPGKWARAAAGG